MRLTIPLAVPSRSSFAYRLRRRGSNAVTIVLFLLPSMAMFLLFVVIPIVQAAHYSLYRWNGLGSLDDYTGLNNYRALFNDPIFLQAIKNNALIAVLSLTLQLPAAFFLALLVNRKLPGRTFFRMIFFLPYTLAPVVIGLIWSFIYDPLNGLVAGLFRQFDPQATPPALLATRSTVLFALFAAISWEFFGFHFILYLTGLQNIPDELVEAAHVDGASSWQIVRYITLPLLGSTIRLSALFSVLGSLQFFDLIWVTTGGGPVNASETMATYQIHYGLQEFRLGYGSAAAVVMFGICLIFALLYQRLIMRQDLSGSAAF
jgi:raffinose/stachyose/melibiose transport system permease protein